MSATRDRSSRRFSTRKVLFARGVAALVLALGSLSLFAQEDAARAALLSAAEAMGGVERLQGIDNLVMTGFGQRFSSNGNSSPDPNSPAKWQSVVDATRYFDLANARALNRERNSFQYPLAASFGHAWALGNQLQQGAALLDHPVSALRLALDPDTTLGAVSSEEGYTVVQFTLDNGEPGWIALDPVTRLPYWSRRITGDGTLGDLTLTTWFTGYVPYEGLQLPLGLLTKSDWRDQVMLMLQVDSYDVDADELPEFPAAPGNAAAPRPVPEVEITPLGTGVWDVRIPGNGRSGDGGAVVEFEDHLVLFEAYGSEAAVLARIDAANTIVAGKQVSHVIITHHHSDHAAGLRAVVSRGLTVIAERGNEALYREWVARSAVHFPDALARAPQPLKFLPVDGTLVLEDGTQRLQVHHVVAHSHMGNAVFAYLPVQKLLLEGDLSDVNWEWHWWAYALQGNIDHYGLDVERVVPVHGEVLPLADNLAQSQRQAEAAQAFCNSQAESGYRFFGCPVKYDTKGLLR